MPPVASIEQLGNVRNPLLYPTCALPCDALLRTEYGDGSVRPEERIVDVGRDPDAGLQCARMQRGEVDRGDLSVEAW